MSIIKVKSRLDEYRYRAQSKDINELSGRPNRSDITNFVNMEIAAKMEFTREDVLVDIGCGDGTLLKLAKEHGASCIGILPTEEEVSRLRDSLSESHSDIKVEKGSASKTDLPSNVATKIVCNGVLLLLSENDAILALKEIVRLAKHNALIYIGEHPFCDEYIGKNYGDSIIAWLLWVLKNQGVRQFGIRLKQTLRAIFSKELMIITPKGNHFCSPDEFIQEARKAGLVAKDNFRHKSITLKGDIVESSSRQDYLFTVTHG